MLRRADRVRIAYFAQTLLDLRQCALSEIACFSVRSFGCCVVRRCLLDFAQTLMERVYDFREQGVKAKQELAAQLDENKELKMKIEQVRNALSLLRRPHLLLLKFL